MKNQIGYTIFFASAVVASWAWRMNSEQEVSATERSADAASRLAEEMVRSGRVAGLSVGIVSMNASGKLQEQTFHFGDASTDGYVPDDDTIYEIGGLSNIFTAVLLAASVTHGELSLDITAAELLPAGVTMPVYNGREITLLDLVTHRSGLPRIADNMPMAKPGNPYDDYTSELAGEFLKSHKPGRPPGTKYEYSNFAMAYLGHLLTVRSGMKDYDALLSQRITQPLKMLTTGTSPEKKSSQVAVGHSADGRRAPPWTCADIPGAAGIRSTIGGLNRFMVAQLKAPDDKFGKAINLAFETQIEPLDNEFAMGLGWLIARDGETRFHNGQTGGFHSAMFVNRQLNLGVCVLSNTASSDVTGLAERIMQQKAGEQSNQPARPELRAEKDLDVPANVMDRYVGRYQLAPTFIFDVRREGNKLMVGITNQATQQVFPRSEGEWYYKSVKAALLFGGVKNGKAQSLTLLQDGARQKASRIEDSDEVTYRKLSPFSAIRWRDAVAEVQVDGTWFEFVSLNDQKAADIMSFSRKCFGRLWKKRFEEDLVELLAHMGHAPEDQVKLVLKSLDSEEIKTFDNVAMSSANRKAIYRAARRR